VVYLAKPSFTFFGTFCSQRLPKHIGLITNTQLHFTYCAYKCSILDRNTFWKGIAQLNKNNEKNHNTLTPLNSILIVNSRATLQQVFLLKGNHNIQYISQFPAIAREFRPHSFSLDTEL
jgi:hypothetical protein